ncbi:MAG: N-acetylmuramoyl-L-alanine amidase [Pirellulales bacterium]|nr:N-acetylmuramoyl-L-alanine amidase [Pirellulales bacterium]
MFRFPTNRQAHLFGGSLLAVAVSSIWSPLAPAAEPRREVPRPRLYVAARAWGSKPDPIPAERRHKPKYVTLHHAGVLWTADRDPVEFLRNMQSWGKRRPEIEQPPRNTYWPDLPYHFLIAPDGRVFEGRPLEYEPESNTKYDLAGHVGVELMGNFEEQRPSLAQVDAAVRTVAWLVDSQGLKLADVSTHAKAAPGQTSCPGRDFARYFDDGQFPKWVEFVLTGKDPEIELGPPLPDGPTVLITDTKPRK